MADIVDKYVLEVTANTRVAEGKIDYLVNKLKNSDELHVNLKLDGNSDLENLKQEFNKLSNIKVKVFDDRQKQEIQTLKNDMGDVLTIVKQLDASDKVISETTQITQNLEKHSKELDKIKQKANDLKDLKNKMIGDVNVSKGFGYLNNSAYDNLIKKIEKINIDTPISRIKELQNQISNLGKNETNVYNLSKAMSKLQQVIDSTKENKDFLNIEENRNKIKQYEEDLKSLQNGLMKRLKNNSGSINQTDMKENIDKINASSTELSNSVKQYNSEIEKSNRALEEQRQKVEQIQKVQEKTEQLNQKDFAKQLNDSVKEQLAYVERLNSELEKGLQEDKTRLEEINSLKSKMNTTVSNEKNAGYLNTEVYDNLIKRIQSINLDTPKEEIRQLQSEINNLGKSDTRILQLTKYIEQLKNVINQASNNKDFLGVEENAKRIEQLKNQVKEAESVLGELKNNSMDINKTSFKEMTDGLREGVRETTKELKATSNETVSFGERMKSVLGNVGIYYTVADAVRKMFEAFKEGISYVEYLDSSFTDMSMTMDISKSQFTEMSSQIDEMAKQLGVSIESIHDLARIYTNATASISDITEKSKYAGMLSNISGMSADETAKGLQSISNQFKSLSENGETAGQVTQHIGDVLTTISANMPMDFAEGIKQLNEAVKTSGSVAEESGVSFEKFSSIMGATMTQSGRSASEVANMFKTISARVQQQKSLTEELGINESDLANASKALKAINVEVADGTNGGLRSMDSILEDIASKWNGLNDATKQYVAYNVAGEMKVYACIYRNIYNSFVLNMCKPNIL